MRALSWTQVERMRLLLRTSCALGLTGTSVAMCHRRTSAPQRRSVEVVIPATRFGATDIPGKEHWRIIGTKDVDDKGTKHAISALDPFIFLDESLNPAGVGGLGNGKHPHAGLSAFTYLSPDLEGTESGLIHAWDNVNGDMEPHRAGSIYIINAGRGALHHEANMTPRGSMHQFQLWVRAAEPLPPASYQLHHKEVVPVVQLPGGSKVTAHTVTRSHAIRRPRLTDGSCTACLLQVGTLPRDGGLAVRADLAR